MKGAHMSFEPIREGLVWGGADYKRKKVEGSYKSH